MVLMKVLHCIPEYNDSYDIVGKTGLVTTQVAARRAIHTLDSYYWNRPSAVT